MPYLTEIPLPKPESLPPPVSKAYRETGLLPDEPIFLTLGDSMGLAGLRGLGISFRGLQDIKDRRIFKVEVYDLSFHPKSLHHREVTELKIGGDQIVEHTVIVPADKMNKRRVIRDVIADAATGQIGSIRLSNERGQLTKTVVRIPEGPDVTFKIEEFDPEEGYIRHTVVVDALNRPSFERTESREYYPPTGKVKKPKTHKITLVEYAGDESKTVEAEFIKYYHYAPDGRTVLDSFIENTITPSSSRRENLHEIKKTHREISDDGETVEGVINVYRPHDARYMRSSERWREVSRTARRGNNLLRLESTVRKIRYGEDGKTAEDENRTLKWQYNEKDQLISVKVESNLIPDFADYMFYKPGQESPYARLRWDSHAKQYILYTTSSGRIGTEGSSLEQGNHDLLWRFSWKEINRKKAEEIYLIPDYVTAGKIIQDMMTPLPANP